MHIQSLRGSVRVSRYNLKQTRRYTDAAKTAHTYASAALTSARQYLNDRRSIEKQATRDHQNFVAAAQAEAALYRRDANIAGR